MNTTNQEQTEYWDKRAGPTWVDMQEHLDALLEPLSAAGLRAPTRSPVSACWMSGAVAVIPASLCRSGS